MQAFYIKKYRIVEQIDIEHFEAISKITVKVK